jgi:hypothetical protein
MVGAVSALLADRLGLVPGPTPPQKTGRHPRFHLRGLHISVQEAVLQLGGNGPGGPGSYAVAFNESVTNTGTLPVSAVVVRPGRTNTSSGWVMPGTNCGVGDISNASKFSRSQVNPGLPINGEVCTFKGGLGPGKTILIGYLTDFTSAGRAAACAHTGAKVVTLTPRQTTAFDKKGLFLRGVERGTFGSPPPPATGSPKALSS